MTHADAGRYAAKHAPGERPDEKIAAALRQHGREGQIACADAERIGKSIGVSLAEVGKTIDLLEFRIGRCQLGLFGYPEGKPLKSDVDDPELETSIRDRLDAGRLPCRTAWEIAEERGMARMKVANACEKMGIRIKPCQLGAF